MIVLHLQTMTSVTRWPVRNVAVHFLQPNFSTKAKGIPQQIKQDCVWKRFGHPSRSWIHCCLPRPSWFKSISSARIPAWWILLLIIFTCMRDPMRIDIFIISASWKLDPLVDTITSSRGFVLWTKWVRTSLTWCRLGGSGSQSEILVRESTNCLHSMAGIGIMNGNVYTFRQFVVS